jgi:hypothetical protein
MPEKKTPSKADDAGQAALQKQIDEENEQGFVGTKVDPTPNENYTAAGQAAGLPTPETDDELAADARKAGGRR